MLNIKLIVIGNLKEAYFRDAIAEYQKRLQSFCKLDIIELKESKLQDEPSAKQIETTLDDEAEKIISNINQKSYKIALCVEGKQYSSEEFAKIIENVSITHGEITLIIGSSFGLSEKIKNMCDMKLSVSKMTLTHQMMRVWLLEIIYRCLSINKGTKYHK